jgi:hypothetical protein
VQKGKEVMSGILFLDAPHSIAHIQLAQHSQKFLDDPIILSTPYVIQSNAYPDRFRHSMEILDGVELHLLPDTFDNLMLLAREFGYNGLVGSLAHRVRKIYTIHYHNSTEKNRTTTIETEFQFDHDSFAVA